MMARSPRSQQMEKIMKYHTSVISAVALALLVGAGGLATRGAFAEEAKTPDHAVAAMIGR